MGILLFIARWWNLPEVKSIVVRRLKSRSYYHDKTILHWWFFHVKDTIKSRNKRRTIWHDILRIDEHSSSKLLHRAGKKLVVMVLEYAHTPYNRVALSKRRNVIVEHLS